jgi:hypothetical protein
MSVRDSIALFGLDEDDAALLLPNIPKNDQVREDQALRAGHKGEPASALIVIALTAAALKAWVAFLVLQGSKRSVTYSYEIRRENGERRTKTIKIVTSSSANVEANIIAQLAREDIDVSLLGNG